eukprot:CAMPEP_0168330624 /NCGR_PEP_ID=MMETSP0213-20121227/7851_1 /TAXON_ID=151035 /ORGANISM="Euplotes harpa, Strain FSP1.4" /LENGTH=199 /DNA_ID=CAMNT_0008334249 /DNA_START=778 /DNA_END=1378 /DNA_ORIENTATION=+
MVNDDASKDKHGIVMSNVFTSSFLEKLGVRPTESMPDLSRTSLNDEIEYDLYGYKLNESSKMDESYPDADSNPNPKFRSIQFYIKNKSQIHPKFLQKLNTLNSYSASSDINLSDQLEAEFLLKTLKPISRHKLIQAPDKPAKSGKAEKTQKPFAYSSPQEEGVSSNQKNMEFTFGKRKAENKVFKKVYRVSVPLDFEKA